MQPSKVKIYVSGVRPAWVTNISGSKSQLSMRPPFFSLTSVLFLQQLWSSLPETLSFYVLKNVTWYKST